MNSDLQWIVVEIDGKISSVSPDFGFFAGIAQKVARMPVESVSRINCYKLSTDEVLGLSPKLKWEDLRPFGSKFQLAVWENLFKMTHGSGRVSCDTSDEAGAEGDAPATDKPAGAGDAEPATDKLPTLLSYSDFADLCGKREGVRAVAHAIAHNPIAIIIPCHLVVPKETIDRVALIRSKQLPSLFEGQNPLADPSLNFGEYRYGTDLKRRLILSETQK